MTIKQEVLKEVDNCPICNEGMDNNCEGTHWCFNRKHDEMYCEEEMWERTIDLTLSKVGEVIDKMIEEDVMDDWTRNHLLEELKKELGIK